MKFTRWIVLAMVALFSMPVWAQDIQGDLALFGFNNDVSFAFFQDTVGGSLTANGDGTYSLMLQGVPAEVTITEVTRPNSEVLKTSDLINDWNAAIASASQSLPSGAPNPFYAQGELDLNGSTLFTTIVGASYDEASQTVTYTVQIKQFVSLELLQGQPFDLANASLNPKELPKTFATASLAIGGNNVFLQVLKEQMVARLGGLRMGEVNCDGATNSIATLQAQIDDLKAQQSAILATVATAGWDSASIESYNALDAQLSETQNQLYYSQGWYDANCQS